MGLHAWSLCACPSRKFLNSVYSTPQNIIKTVPQFQSLHSTPLKLMHRVAGFTCMYMLDTTFKIAKQWSGHFSIWVQHKLWGQKTDHPSTQLEAVVPSIYGTPKCTAVLTTKWSVIDHMFAYMGDLSTWEGKEEKWGSKGVVILRATLWLSLSAWLQNDQCPVWGYVQPKPHYFPNIGLWTKDLYTHISVTLGEGPIPPKMATVSLWTHSGMTSSHHWHAAHSSWVSMSGMVEHADIWAHLYTQIYMYMYRIVTCSGCDSIALYVMYMYIFFGQWTLMPEISPSITLCMYSLIQPIIIYLIKSGLHTCPISSHNFLQQKIHHVAYITEKFAVNSVKKCAKHSMLYTWPCSSAISSTVL